MPFRIGLRINCQSPREPYQRNKQSKRQWTPSCLPERKHTKAKQQQQQLDNDQLKLIAIFDVQQHSRSAITQ